MFQQRQWEAGMTKNKQAILGLLEIKITEWEGCEESKDFNKENKIGKI